VPFLLYHNIMKKVNWPLFVSGLKDAGVKVFSPLDIVRIFGISYRNSSAFLNYYLRKGLILKLRKGFYVLKDNVPSDFFIAGQIYQPSYISLDTALSFYGIIPEVVYSLISITTRRTANFEILGKNFTYRKIKPKAFTGYYLKEDKGESFNIAFPEKALVDYLYFSFLGKRKISDRLNLESVKTNDVLFYANLFESDRFMSFVKIFLKENANS